MVDPARRRRGEVVKRIRLLILLGMVAVALPLGLLQGVAKATGGSGSTTSVSISPTADFNTFGGQLDLLLFVRCTGVSGTADVTVTQTTPESGDPVAMGIGSNPAVVCDGQTHSVGVTVTGGLFDPGKAYAVADVTPLPGGSGPRHAERSITIFVH
jgi:hypothetical protein